MNDKDLKDIIKDAKDFVNEKNDRNSIKYKKRNKNKFNKDKSYLKKELDLILETLEEENMSRLWILLIPLALFSFFIFFIAKTILKIIGFWECKGCFKLFWLYKKRNKVDKRNLCNSCCVLEELEIDESI